MAAFCCLFSKVTRRVTAAAIFLVSPTVGQLSELATVRPQRIRRIRRPSASSPFLASQATGIHFADHGGSIMPKFYVQCGPIRTILQAESGRHAAMSALDHTLQSHLWIYDDPELSEQDRQDHLMLEALLHLEPAVEVSEIGFDRADAELYSVPQLIVRWHRLMIGMNRLFAAAGLGPRSMATVAGVQLVPSVAPRLPR